MLGLLYFVVNMVISVILFFVVYVGTVLLAQLPEGKIYDRSLYYTSYNYIMTNTAENYRIVGAILALISGVGLLLAGVANDRQKRI